MAECVVTSSGAPVGAWSAAVDRAAKVLYMNSGQRHSQPWSDAPTYLKDGYRRAAERSLSAGLPGLLADLAEQIDRKADAKWRDNRMTAGNCYADAAAVVRGYSDTLGGQNG